MFCNNFLFVLNPKRRSSIKNHYQREGALFANWREAVFQLSTSMIYREKPHLPSARAAIPHPVLFKVCLIRLISEIIRSLCHVYSAFYYDWLYYWSATLVKVTRIIERGNRVCILLRLKGFFSVSGQSPTVPFHHYFKHWKPQRTGNYPVWQLQWSQVNLPWQSNVWGNECKQKTGCPNSGFDMSGVCLAAAPV